MDIKNIPDRRSGLDRRSPISVADNKYCEKLRKLKVRIVMTTKQEYVGDFFLPEVKRRLSDAINDEKPFINLTNVSIDGSSNLIPFIALKKNQMVSIEDLTANATQDPNK